MEQTSNYQLNQWHENDRILMEDFNADNAKIEAALAELKAAIPKFACGAFTGDGAASRTIEVGFTPKAVYVCPMNGRVFHSAGTTQSYYGGLATPDAPVQITAYNGTQIPVLSVTETGFQVHYQQLTVGSTNYMAYSNMNETEMHYVALG